MQLNITFRRFEGTDSIKEYALEKVERMKKHLGNPDATEAHLVLSLERHLQHADLTVYAEGKVLRGHDASTDLYAAIDLAIERVHRQLSRHHDRARHHHDRVLVHHGSRLIDAESVQEEIAPVAHARAESKNEQGRIIRSDERLETLSQEEAARQLDLTGGQFLAFVDSSSRTMSVIYRRKDGHYGLIEPAAGRTTRRASASP
jgi:putative sigma-54 modulation protein